MTSMMLNGKGRIQNTWCNFSDVQSSAAALTSTSPGCQCYSKQEAVFPSLSHLPCHSSKSRSLWGGGTSEEVGRLDFSFTEGPPTPF